MRVRLLGGVSLIWLVACPPPPTEPPADAGGLCADGGSPFADGGCAVPEVGCDAGTQLTIDGGCRSVGWSTCPAGFTAAPGGWDCAPVTSATPCGPGTRAQLGDAACAPVGWQVCPPGFAPEPSGWGCAPVLPAASCSGATRESFGSPTCVPVGDCTAPFPPPAATVFVDDSFTAGQLDATHFATISSALAAAGAGAISVEAGSYLEALVPPRPVTLIGRCAEQVTLRAPANLAALTVLVPRAVELQGFTVRDSRLALRLETGAVVTVRQSILEANLRSGIQVLDAPTELTLEEVVVRGTLPDSATNTFGQGLAASLGARVTLTDVVLVANREVGLFLDRAGTRATLTRVLISGTLPRASTGRLGWGIGVQGGAQLELARSAILGNHATGLAVVQASSRATVTDSVVNDTRAGRDNADQPIALNVAVLLGGSLDWTGGGLARAGQGHLQVQASTATLRDVTLRGIAATVPLNRALGASQGAQLTLTGSAIVDSVGSGLDALDPGTVVTLDQVLFAGIAPEPGSPGSGMGVRAQEQARVTATGVVIERASAAGALATDGGTLILGECVVTGTTAGFGVVAQTGGTASVSRTLIEKNAGAGVYANGPGSRATVSQSLVRLTTFDSNGEFGQGVVVESGATAELTDVGVVANRTAGIQVGRADAGLTLTRTTVRGTLPNADGTRGRGANATFGGALNANDSAFVDNQQVGVFVFQSQAELKECLVLGTRPDPDGKYGNGLEVLTDASLLMRGGALQSNAGIGAVFAEGAGLLDAVRISRQVVGLHAQDGSTVEELATAPATLGPRQVVVTRSTGFFDNESKLGGSVVPVPTP